MALHDDPTARGLMLAMMQDPDDRGPWLALADRATDLGVEGRAEWLRLYGGTLAVERHADIDGGRLWLWWRDSMGGGFTLLPDPPGLWFLAEGEAVRWVRGEGWINARYL